MPVANIYKMFIVVPHDTATTIRRNPSSMSPDRTASLAHFAFIPLPNFTMIAFTNAIEVLRMANYLTGQKLYTWSIVSPEGGPVSASNGLSVDTGPVEGVG